MSQCLLAEISGLASVSENLRPSDLCPGYTVSKSSKQFLIPLLVSFFHFSTKLETVYLSKPANSIHTIRTTQLVSVSVDLRLPHSPPQCPGFHHAKMSGRAEGYVARSLLYMAPLCLNRELQVCPTIYPYPTSQCPQEETIQALLGN